MASTYQRLYVPIWLIAKGVAIWTVGCALSTSIPLGPHRLMPSSWLIDPVTEFLLTMKLRSNRVALAKLLVLMIEAPLKPWKNCRLETPVLPTKFPKVFWPVLTFQFGKPVSVNVAAKSEELFRGLLGNAC